MAVIVKYVVVSHGKEDMIFSTKKEAEAHDKMLDIAEQLYTFLQAAEISIAEDTLEALTLFMAQQREPIGTILKGGKLKPPGVSAQQAASLSQGKREEPSSSEQKSNKASQSAPPTKPKAAA